MMIKIERFEPHDVRGVERVTVKLPASAKSSLALLMMVYRVCARGGHYSSRFNRVSRIRK